MHEESLYNSGCDSWIKQQTWLIYFYLCFSYTCLYVWYSCMHINGRGCMLGAHMYMCPCELGGLNCHLVSPSIALHLMFWVRISNLTLELAIWDILPRQLVAGIVCLICSETAGGHRLNSELCWCLGFNFWFSFVTYQHIFSVSGMNYFKKILDPCCTENMYLSH